MKKGLKLSEEPPKNTSCKDQPFSRLAASNQSDQTETNILKNNLKYI